MHGSTAMRYVGTGRRLPVGLATGEPGDLSLLTARHGVVDGRGVDPPVHPRLTLIAERGRLADVTRA
jgi:hypothetical protein